MTTYTLPFPPLVNRLHRNVVIRGNARTLLSSAGREYKRDAGYALLLQMAGAQALQGALSVEMHCYRPEYRGDVDGPIKATLDAANRILWKDDSQIDALLVYRHTDPGNPRIELTVEETAPTPTRRERHSPSHILAGEILSRNGKR